MMRVMDLTGRTAALVDVQASLACEMLAILVAFTSPDTWHTLENQPWSFDELRTRLRSDFIEGLDQPWGALFGLATLPPLAWDVEALIHRVEAMSEREFTLLLLGYNFPTLRQTHGVTIQRAADGELQAVQQLLADSEYAEWGKGSVARAITLPPEDVRRRLIGALRAWHTEVFQPMESWIGGVLRRDAQAKAAVSRTMPSEQFIDFATGGLQYSPHPPFRRVLLVPHVAMRPWNLLNEFEDTYIICYPVADESLRVDRTAPPARLVRLYRALDDEKRLRILKRLARSSATLQEVAEVAGVAKSTAHHHLVILRSAGLVRTGIDKESRYSLRSEAIPEVAGWLEAFLKENLTV